MSGAANDAKGGDAVRGDDLVEAKRDEHETWMTYGEGRMPWWVLAVWVVALGGLITYTAIYWVPDLTSW